MEKITNHEQINKIWNLLPFSCFNDEKKKVAWCQYADQIIAGLNVGGTGLIADTGTGKTVMAFLVFKALKLRTLFVTPTVILTKQHADLYQKITGQEAVTMSGQKKDRDWRRGELIIATPHVFMVDYRKGLTSANDFDLLIVDELHKGQGFYPYVPISSLFKLSAKKILCLSASPGVSHQEIEKMEKLYQIKTWITAEIETPEKKQRLIKASLTPLLKQCDANLKKYYLETLKDLDKVFKEQNHQNIISLNDENPYLTQAENDKLEKLVEALPIPEFYVAKSLFAKQYKLSYLFKLLMSEGYYSFLNYVEENLKNDKSKAAQAILIDSRFIKTYWQIKNLSEDHPKEAALFSIVREMLWRNKNMLVFVNSKKTARYLSAWYNERGYKTDCLLGGASKSLKAQDEVIKKLATNKIQIIFATSVVEEGLSLPEIDAVIHYNQPQTGIARLQRGGRTGRFNEGLVVFIVMDIPYENALYFATLSKLKKMQQIFYESARTAEREKKLQKKKSKINLSGQYLLNFPEDRPF